MPQPGVNTPHDGLSTKSKTQLLDEALNHVDEVAQLVGGEWLDAGVPPTVFSLDDREGWSWLSCDDRATTGQYDVNVRQRADAASAFDPDAVTEKVRAYWEGLGYRVRQIGPTGQDSGGHRSIIVDLPHSASISFSANTEILGISASGECTKWD
jgi:hypothetical protein